MEKSHQLYERLTPFDIMSAQLRALLNLLDTIVPLWSKNFNAIPKLSPCDAETRQSQTAVRLIIVEIAAWSNVRLK